MVLFFIPSEGLKLFLGGGGGIMALVFFFLTPPKINMEPGNDGSQ